MFVGCIGPVFCRGALAPQCSPRGAGFRGRVAPGDSRSSYCWACPHAAKTRTSLFLCSLKACISRYRCASIQSSWISTASARINRRQLSSLGKIRITREERSQLSPIDILRFLYRFQLFTFIKMNVLFVGFASGDRMRDWAGGFFLIIGTEARGQFAAISASFSL